MKRPIIRPKPLITLTGTYTTLAHRDIHHSCSPGYINTVMMHRGNTVMMHRGNRHDTHHRA